MKREEKSFIKETELSGFSKEQMLKSAVQTSFDLGQPMAIWRLPNTNEINFISSFDSAKPIDKVELSELPEGFIFSKFEASQGRFFIESDVKMSFDFDEMIANFDTNERSEVFRSKLVDQLDVSCKKPMHFMNKELALSNSGSYEALVRKAVEAIKADHFEKVVPARAKEVGFSEEFDVINLFLRLCEAYENAFVSFVSIPNEGSWLGASPEVLIETDGPMFTTVSLAGTRKAEEGVAVGETSWNQKEIEEQAMVSRYIINCFKKIRLREYEEKGPKTTIAGNLLHLKTTFKVNMEETNFPELPSVMLELLHPTSAIAGMPKEAALQFIQENERLDRSYYSGYLGPVNVQSSTHIFVNLRCMQLFNKHALLYAGAGVTEDSNPEKEYLETEMKCNTLLNKITHKI